MVDKLGVDSVEYVLNIMRGFSTNDERSIGEILRVVKRPAENSSFKFPF